MNKLKKDLTSKGLATQIIHCGHQPDPTTGAVASPIYQTATYAAKSVEDFEELCQNWGYVYSRESNPTISELEEKLAMLEKGEAALATSSGMGAITSSLLTLLRSGDHIISSAGIFSHTKLFMQEALIKFGVEITFVNATDPELIRHHIKANTKLIFLETPLNPSLDLVDIRSISTIAHEKDILVMVDSTFAPPPIQQALTLGADLCVHSLTKYINGHGDSLGGVVVGSKAIIDKIKWPGMPCFTGSALSPFNAWLILRGMKTLDLRVRQHCANAMELARFLVQHPYVARVHYPALPCHPQYELCQTQMNGLGGGIISFALKEGIHGLTQNEGSRKLANHLEICIIATSLGEPQTLVQLEKSGLVRIAVGLETATDLIDDFRQALDKL